MWSSCGRSVEDPKPVRKLERMDDEYPSAPNIPLEYAQNVRVADHTPGFGSPSPSYYEHTSSSASGVEQAGRSEDNTMIPERSRTRWVTFVVGNALSAAVIIYEMSQLVVCFDGVVGDLDSDDTLDSTDVEELIEYDALLTRDIVMFTLGFSLLVEVFSAVVLSATYKSPLDMKSVHKIPSDDLRNLCGTITKFVLPPFSWSLIYLLGGIASIYYSLNSSCEGQGGSSLVLYLQVSGTLMVFGGIFFLGVSVFSLWLTCPSCNKYFKCCKTARETMNARILTKGLFIDTFWMVQGVVWSYRTGAFAQNTSVTLGLFSVLGEGLAAFGSLALDVADCCSGCL